MYDDEVRIERLERRVNQLQARLHRVEAAIGVPAAAPGGDATASQRPPARAVDGDRVQVPRSAPAPVLPATPASEPPGAPVHALRTPPPVAPAPATPWAAWAQAPAEPSVGAQEPQPRSPISLRDLEERFAGRALAWIGGFALVAAAVFFLSLAFSRGWINEPLRVLIGLVVGSAGFGLGAWFLDRRNALMGNVLTAVGLGIISIALFAATRLYDLVPPELGLAGALVAALAAAVIAIRCDARVVAAYGLIAALVAPPVVGASPTLLTLGFVAVTLAGTTAIAVHRSWRWLPPLAFVLAAPQLAGWLTGDPDPAQALVALAGFWLVNAVAAAGEEVRIRRDDLRPSSATLLLANATFLLWGGFVVLAADLEPWRGTFIALASLAHLALGGWFLRRQSLEHLFGNLAAGTGVALLAIAAFVQLGAPAVPLAWAAEAVALAWLASRRHHRWSALAATALGVLVAAHLLVLEYPLRHAGIPADPVFATPFLHPEAASLGAVLLAVAVTVALVPVRWVRSLLVGVAIPLAAYGLTFELTGPPLTAAFGLLVVGGLVLDRLVDRLPVDATLAPFSAWATFAWFGSAASLGVGAMALALFLGTEYPVGTVGALSPTPFLHPAAASLAILLVTLVAAGALVPVRWVRSALAALGLLLVAWALPFEVRGTALVASLALLLPVAVIGDRALARWPEQPRFSPLGSYVWFVQAATLAGAVAWTGAAAYALDRYLNPVWWGSVRPPDIPFSDERALAGCLLVAASLAAARWLPAGPSRTLAVIAAIAAAAAAVPFEVYADGVVVLWVGLAVLAVLAARVDAGSLVDHTVVGGLLTAGAAAVAWIVVARPDRLWVVDPAYVAREPMLGGWPLAFAALGLVLWAASRHPLLAQGRAWLEVAAGMTGVYLVSVGVVDAFQSMAGGATTIEELAKQAQVALSVCWTSIGAVALVVGLARRHPMLRHAGLGLLAMATAKVFAFDLAAMDVAYRALVLAGLGVLLLFSAWLFTHFRGPRSGAAGMHGGMRPTG